MLFLLYVKNNNLLTLSVGRCWKLEDAVWLLSFRFGGEEQGNGVLFDAHEFPIEVMDV